MTREEKLQAMMANGEKHDATYRKRLAKDAALNADAKAQMEQQQTTLHQLEDGAKPKFIQKIQTGQFGVTNDASLEENMRRKRASQQTGDYMNAL